VPNNNPVPQFAHIAPSKIMGAGYGVFANIVFTVFRKGDYIAACGPECFPLQSTSAFMRTRSVRNVTTPSNLGATTIAIAQ